MRFLQQIEQLADVPISIESTSRYLKEMCQGQLKNGGVNGVWDSAASGTRGDVIAFIKGQNLPQNYYAVDYFDDVTGPISSIKSLDPSLPSYLDQTSFVKDYKRFLEKEAIFVKTGKPNGDINGNHKINSSQIKIRRNGHLCSAWP